MSATEIATKFVYDFSEGSREMRELLGGKGANVAEMTRILDAERVPGGFTITTEACVGYMNAGGSFPDGLSDQIAAGLARLQERAGRRWATRTTRCWCPCDPARASRCRA